MPDSYSVERVVSMVERMDRATRRRRDRMDADYRLQRGDPYNTNTDAGEATGGTDFKSFTANEAASFVKKVVAVLAGAELLVQVPYGRAQRSQQAMYDLKERFAEGCTEQANDELANMIKIPLLDQLCWFAPNRGWLTVRALLMNEEDESTHASAWVWDPRNVYWEVGRGGLLWVCNRVERPAAQVLSEYPRANLNAKEDDDPIVVYDMYTPTTNGVMTDTNMLKVWTPHGSPRVPVIVTPVPTQPEIWSSSGTVSSGIPDSMDDYGESVLATNRNLYPLLNEAMSITLELMAKAREPASGVFSDEEDPELESDPNRKGGVHYFNLADRYEQFRVPETTKDAIQFMSILTGMLQRGALPYSAYGEVNFTLSGYAITQLNQQMITVIGPQTRAIARTMKGVLDLWADQFNTGTFNPISIRGLGRNKDYMQFEIRPEMIANLPPYQVKLVAQLPQDDISRMAAAQQARTAPPGGTPFLPDRWLWDTFLHLPDVALIDNMIKEQASERASPAAAALTFARSALEQGDQALAQIYIDQYVQSMLLSKMMATQTGMGAPGSGGAGGLPPTTLPFLAGGGQPGIPNAPTGLEGNAGLPRMTEGTLG